MPIARTTMLCLAAGLLCAAAGCDTFADESVESGGSGQGATSGGEAVASADGDEDEAPPSAEERAAGAGVRILETLDGQGRTEVVGLVDVHEPTGRESLGLADLKARAAKLGAQALTSVEVHPPAPGENITHFSGMAIRFDDLLQGRTYDVVGQIDVDAAMMHEDDAFAEVQRRGRSMGADLLLNVRFSHGDGTTPLHVLATAIKLH